jgi:hypothetical protein
LVGNGSCLVWCFGLGRGEFGLVRSDLLWDTLSSVPWLI